MTSPTDPFAAKAEARREAALGKSVPAPAALERAATERLQLIARARRAGLEKRTDLKFLASADAVDGLARLASENGESFHIRWHEDAAVPRFIAGESLLNSLSSQSLESSEALAFSFLEDQKALLRIEHPETEFVPFDVARDANGFEAVRFEQSYRDRSVWARDVVVRLDPAGQVIGFSGHHLPTQAFPAAEPTVSEAEAAAVAAEYVRDHYGMDPTIESAEILYFPTSNGVKLAWHLLTAGGLAHKDDVFVDALSGEYLHIITRICADGPVDGQGVDLSGTNRALKVYDVDGTFFLINTTKAMFNAAGSTLPNAGKGVVQILDAQNGTSDLFHPISNDPNSWPSAPNAVSSAFFASRVYDYFQNNHARNSIDGNGMNMTVIVNFDNNFNNAFWNGTFMVFGNGDGNAFSDLAGSFDVTAHEMSHGVIEHTANLIYEFQSGALNEHFADAFGASADFSLNPSTANWLLGEHVTTPNINGDCLRNMEDPGAANVAFNGQQPRDMSEFQVLGADVDNGGVHINSGIPNRAFYIAVVDQGLGIVKGERIWYRALSQYLTRNSQFTDFRLATIRAALDLYGASDAAAVAAAMDAVGLVDGEPNNPPGDLPDNMGVDQLAAIDVDSGNIFRSAVPPGGIEGWSFENISGQGIGPGGRPSFSDDGAWFTWVDDTDNVRLTRVNGAEDFALTTDGNWFSVAINSDASFVSATSLDEDGTIYFFDLENEQVLGIELESQNSTDGSTPDFIAYADVMEFTVAGDHLIYDALNRTTIGEQTLEYWEISLVRLTDGEFFRVFQPLPADQSVGNPTLGQNNDNRMAFDFIDADGSVNILGFDFETGTDALIANNVQSLGRPTFSGDDKKVYYQFSSGETNDIWVVSLAADGITGQGDDEGIISDGLWPVHFTVGTRPVPVLLSAFEGDWSGEEIRIEWELPDPELYVGFEVERAATGGEFGPVSANIERVDGARGRYRILDLAPEEGSSLTYRLQAIAPSGELAPLGELQVNRGQGSSANAKLSLLSVAPNPVTNSARFRLAIPADSNVRTSLSVHDVTGRLVARPLDDVLEAGIHEIEWDARGDGDSRLAAGVYFIRLEQGREQVTRRISILR